MEIPVETLAKLTLKQVREIGFESFLQFENYLNQFDIIDLKIMQRFIIEKRSLTIQEITQDMNRDHDTIRRKVERLTKLELVDKWDKTYPRFYVVGNMRFIKIIFRYLTMKFSEQLV